MGWSGTSMLTNGEHDTLLRNGAHSVVGIHRALNVANAIAIAKELYEISDKSESVTQDYEKTPRCLKRGLSEIELCVKMHTTRG